VVERVSAGCSTRKGCYECLRCSTDTEPSLFSHDSCHSTVRIPDGLALGSDYGCAWCSEGPLAGSVYAVCRLVMVTALHMALLP